MKTEEEFIEEFFGDKYFSKIPKSEAFLVKIAMTKMLQKYAAQLRQENNVINKQQEEIVYCKGYESGVAKGKEYVEVFNKELSQKRFCELYSQFNGVEIEGVKQINFTTLTGEELYELFRFMTRKNG